MTRTAADARADAGGSADAGSRTHAGHARTAHWLWLGVLVVALAVSVVMALGIGSVPLSPGEVVGVIARRLRLITGADVTPLADQIVWQLRLPRVLASIAAGAVLAVCGAILQTLTGNALADPYLLGISSGASVGAVFVLEIGLSVGLSQSVLMMGAAFVGAVLAMLLVLVLATGRGGELPPARTVLAGVAVAQVCAAITSLLIMVFGGTTAARTAMEWMLGSFAGARWLAAGVLAGVALVTLVGAMGYSRTLDAFSFGDTSAASLGINVTRVRWGLMIFTALTTAMTVAFVGPIGFVGLTVPHIMRLLGGPRHAGLLPLTALGGALLLLWSDTAARSITGNTEIPVGVITALLGTPVLAVLLRRQASQ
ncbi:iron chelate uptake ABC transporter family permease subunit [Propionibacterium freudenreichii]|uniref:FecCD family ABC transporter permease n=1 Tax=Propionibacterium freudenreichii TaxID=1744 RepID=UPI000BC33091|nr:iron chelate uptake ABC transporter family permease subunit [Propionibacterium freudenreichii]MDK9294234.1 iron chelate uptake ABC transporter family permease subunit [Propionibacterium freudenreichii]MDK9359689.1 iron chelate uptake ABC transporter family permease subunit [Propionibacterium freudenreichii]MDK9638838.1 iron chelate uptake ABC transporter family permease subunit [Propionibacterium freudenreichii]WGU90417.1 iron chelate uptake ABC transporter family permease subunit [Propionib